MKFFSFLIYFGTITACDLPRNDTGFDPIVAADTVEVESASVGKTRDQSTLQEFKFENSGDFRIRTGTTTPDEILSFARSLIGVPYLYASSNPQAGLDCSGFITYVFNHFDIAVPRSSAGFTNLPNAVLLETAKPGDIILFTGTDSSIRTVGHMGIIISTTAKKIEFIHSTSGRANGVTISPLNKLYMNRFVKVIRIFRSNEKPE